MSNLSYCRYQNTLSDLNDCFRDMRVRWDEGDSIDAPIMKQIGNSEEYESKLSEEERRAQMELIELCREIVELADEQTGE
jgi:hypothetical protein